jgi:pimeloyl-ACP methyl ester carboxylesterase
MDHDEPDGASIRIALSRVPATDPANRIGSLFVNPGGPGGEFVTYLQDAGAGLFADLNARFDIVAFAPRGVAPSTPAVDCQVDPETQGPTVTPTPTPFDVDLDALVARAQSYVDACLAANGTILEHLSTANVAHDLDLLRAAVGDEQLSYLGFSYGTVIGATYASLYPEGYRALVLDAAVDAHGYLNDPLGFTAEQAAGFEVALARFAEACAVDQVACSGFGGIDPYLAYDQLLAAAETAPIPADAYPADPRPVTADDIRLVTARLLYAEQLWGLLGLVLSEAANGDASFIRAHRVTGSSPSARPSSATRGTTCRSTWNAARSPGRPSRTSGATAGTPRSTTRCGRCATRTPTPVPSRRPLPRRRRW